MSMPVAHLLSRCRITPVLVDVGASAGPPGTWRALEPLSVYVGFDPDLRDVRDTTGGAFRRSFMLNRAVTANADADTVTFFLTASPHCSSTLLPDHVSLENYLFADLFRVNSTSVVPAVTMDAMMDQLNLQTIDWLKLDSQGTDLRIFTSIREELRRRVLAVDIEPGLMDAYKGEDLFIDAHRRFLQEGFWLSDLRVKGAARIQTSTVRELERSIGVGSSAIARAVRQSPGWCEARYLRDVATMSPDLYTARDFVMLWAVAMLDRQFGYALDVALVYRRYFGSDSASRAMHRISSRQLTRLQLPRRLIATAAVASAKARVWRQAFSARRANP